MSQAELDQNLRDWVNWLFPQPWDNNNAATDPSGNATILRNDDRDIWFLSGTWGGAPAIREVKVPKDTKLFIVIASSHAIPKELKVLQSPILNPSNQDLIDHARKVHALWKNHSITLDNNPKQIETAETGVLMPYLADNGYYFNGPLRETGPRRMATFAYVALLNSGNKAGDKHVIKFKANSPNHVTLKEPAYDVDVTYSLTAT